jgi:hypothetical protein
VALFWEKIFPTSAFGNNDVDFYCNNMPRMIMRILLRIPQKSQREKNMEGNRFATLTLPSCFRILACFLFFLAPSCWLICQGAVLTVPGGYSTIQAAIDAAAEGDEIIVSQGTYYENINFNGKNIILRSTDPTSPTIVASTIIDANHHYSVVTFWGSELTSCVLSGFTIANGYSPIGAGICGYGTLATIEYNTIVSNEAYRMGLDPGSFGGFGGGLYGCNGTIQNNIVSNNSSPIGAAMCYCDGIIQNNIVSYNSAQFGGGLYHCGGIIQNNTIYSNSSTAARSSGAGLYRCSAIIRNCIIWENSAYTNAQLDDCSTPSYSCIQNWTGPGTGNISDYPLMSNPQNGDFHLDYDSPCIDAGSYVGTLTHDFEEDPRGYDGSPELRGDGSNYDIGADEFVAARSNHPPHKPTNLLPSNGDTGVSLPPSLRSSAFSDPDPGNVHTASQWQIDNNNDFSSPEYDSLADFFNKTTTIALSENIISSPEFYYWRVRYRDNHGYWSGWSDSTSFLTLPPSVILVPDDYSTIQVAIDTASGADTIIVSPGTYYENINLRGKNIMLRSTDPSSPTIVASTVIDGNQAGPVVAFSGTETPLCVLSGFTLTNGSTREGGGISGNYTLATIEQNVISANIAYDGGGLHECDGIIQNNIISGNVASDYGGGLYDCDGIIKNNTISNNTVQYGSGGGLSQCDGSILSNTISGNSAFRLYGSGGGLYRCNGTIQNNIILGNSVQGYNSTGGGLAYCNGAIQGNTIADNAAFGDLSYGGGLYYCGSTIKANSISGNSAYAGGGLSGCGGIIQSNIIYDNWADQYGGGLSGCGGIIQNNIIHSNAVRDRFGGGGGLSGCNGIIQNNTIVGNSAQYGGGLRDCAATIVNCIITGNESYGIYEGSSYSDPDEVRYCNIYGNSSGDYYDHDTAASYTGIEINNLPRVESCISADPHMVDPAQGNFRLLPSSPCIDAGCWVVGLDGDFEADPRPYDGTAQVRGDGSDFDIGADEFRGMVTLRDYDFGLTSERWTSVTLPVYFTPPDCFYMAGYIVLTAQGNTNTYGFWGSEPDAVPVIADCLYRARWTVATDVTDPLRVPHMQLRVNSQNFQQADVLAVSSCGDGSYAPTPEGRTYEMYFLPPESCLGKPEDQDDLMLSFDILNFDPEDAADGSLLLDSVAVEAIPLDTLSTPAVVKTWSFDAGEEGWEFGSAPLFFTSPVSGVSGGALWLIAENNTNTFGYWSGPSDEVHAEEGKLYRVRFGVSTNVVNQEEVAQLRLRVSSEDFQASTVKVISSVMGGEMSPSPAVHTYEVYFYPPQSLVGTEADSILAAFDMLNFDPADAPTCAFMLDGVVVESFSISP